MRLWPSGSEAPPKAVDLNRLAIYWDFPAQVRTLQDAYGNHLLLLTRFFSTHRPNVVHTVATRAHAHHNLRSFDLGPALPEIGLWEGVPAVPTNWRSPHYFSLKY